MQHTNIKTLGELKAAGYQPQSVKDELRRNLIAKIKGNEAHFQGIIGYDETVIPDVQRALLSRHNMILLGLRGQAKTRIARLMVELLDEYIPIIAGSEINDDPFAPISRYGHDLLKELGDDTPIAWLHRNERYTEKLATPDVTVADLIGDVDPIKAATLKLPYSDERTLHFGLIPRSHRGIFVINELPDLQARIQVSLFNILQEGDIQIRGFKLRLPLDVAFVFTANPEDYTQRGSIVTPLKDRIESQILTHYPKDIQQSRRITAQEARMPQQQREAIQMDEICANLIEEIAMAARNSEYVDAKSGVSARLTISAYENLYSAAERRMLINGETNTYSRIGDLIGVIPAITGKIELVYEGEREGASIVANKLISKAMRKLFADYFPNPEKIRKGTDNPYKTLSHWFSSGKKIDLLHDFSEITYQKALNSVPNLKDFVLKYHKNAKGESLLLLMELVLHGMAEYSLVSKNTLVSGLQFTDILAGMLGNSEEDDDEDDYGGYYEKK